MAEWLKAPVSKTGIPVNPVSRVRISPCPSSICPNCARSPVVRSSQGPPLAARTFGCERDKVMSGRVAEWFKAHAWKVCVR